MNTPRAYEYTTHNGNYIVSQKSSTLELMAITLSIFNGFSKFSHGWKEKKIYNKTRIPVSHQYAAALSCESYKFEFVVISKKTM